MRVEVGVGLAPIKEIGGPDYFFRMYDIQGSRPDVARQLGNIYPGDGARFHGRGFPQITGRSNYRNYGDRLGIDLENNPDLALDPQIAGQVMALYFIDHGIPELANRGTYDGWRRVRAAVNGGYTGWDLFYGCVQRLGG